MRYINCVFFNYFSQIRVIIHYMNILMSLPPGMCHPNKGDIMSQAKVERYKQEKANRKQIMAREKRKHMLTVICGWAIAIAIVGWAGYSAYNVYEKSRPMETIYANLDSINDYMSSLDTEE